MAFHLTVAGSLEPLADELAAVFADPLDDPFTPELVAVPGGGVQAWLVARLAGRLGATAGAGRAVGDGPGGVVGDGIVANVEFVFPAGIVARAVGEGTGIGRWATGPLTWAVHEVLQEVGPGLGQPTDAVRARSIADLFDRYTLYRPQMVRGWSEGRPVDGVGARLDDTQLWQYELWRAVQARLGGPTDAELLARAAEALEADDCATPPALPARVVLFGLASLPPAHLRLLSALARHVEVHVLAPTSSPARWDHVAEQLPVPLRLPVRRGSDDEEPLVVSGGHPLVSSWGRASREANLLLLDQVRQSPDPEIAPPAPVEVVGSDASLLHRLQHAVRADEALPVSEDRRTLFDPAVDPSVRWHRAHGPARQVEVLRDALLHLFEETTADGSLRFEARDVAVLCPDPSRFAPLIEAAFSGDPEHGVPSVPVRVADRSLRQDNPVLDTAAALLDLLEGRFRASSVIAFASRPPVRLRFGFDADALTRISEWAEATNVRWGLGPDDHAAFGLPADLDVHTWRAGLDQLLVGATMAAAGPRLGPGDVALHPGVEGSDVAVVGALAELVDRLDVAVARLRSASTVDTWCTAMAEALAELCAVPDTEAWQWQAVERALEELRTEAGVEGVPRTTPVDPVDMAVLVRARLATGGGRPRFGTGAVTVSSLTAQRGVPHQVVCLLGLDDDVAAGGLPVSEDLVASVPCVGDRDTRSEQRAQLLDALLAAECRLLVFSTGHDLRTNAELPPMVPLAELLDVVDGTVRLAPGAGAGARRPSEALTVEHPRQAWSESALEAGRLGTPGPWSFDLGALEAARARRRQVPGAGVLLPEPLPPSGAPDGSGRPAGSVDDGPEIPLDELVTACCNAPELLLRRRLQLSLPTADEERDDAIPLKLAPLEAWKVTDRLLQVRLACDPAEMEATEEAWEHVERRRGAVPPLAFGAGELTESRRRVVALHQALLDALGEVVHDPRPVPLDALLELPTVGRRRLSGTVAGVCGPVVVDITASRVRAKHHLQAWVRVAALTAARPDVAWRAVTVGRDADAADKATPRVLEVRMVDHAAALEALDVLADLRERALRDVVPVFAQTSHDLWAKGLGAAKSSWESTMGGDGHDRWVALALGGEFDDLLSLPPRPDEPVVAGPGARAGWWAERVWGTLERTTAGTRPRPAASDADADAGGAAP